MPAPRALWQAVAACWRTVRISELWATGAGHGERRVPQSCGRHHAVCVTPTKLLTVCGWLCGDKLQPCNRARHDRRPQRPVPRRRQAVREDLAVTRADMRARSYHASPGEVMSLGGCAQGLWMNCVNRLDGGAVPTDPRDEPRQPRLPYQPKRRRLEGCYTTWKRLRPDR